jgi:hypothetical protein
MTYSISEPNMWQWMKEKDQLLDASFIGEAFCAPEPSHFKDIEKGNLCLCWKIITKNFALSSSKIIFP